MDLVQHKFGDAHTPNFLLGMSLGGRIALKTAETKGNQVRGVGLLAPYIKSQSMAGLQFKYHIAQIV